MEGCRKMVRKCTVWVIVVVIVFFLAGCWDQRLLKEGRLVYASAFDLQQDEKIKTTAIVQDMKNGIPTNVLIQGEGNTIRETRMDMDNKLSGDFDPSKNRIFLLGEELAQKDIYQFLDIFYRDPSSSISANIVVTEGNGEDILEKMTQKNTLIAEFLIELLSSAENSTLVPKQDVQSIWTNMLDPGKDFALPLISLKDDEVVLAGTGLFHKHALVGSLTLEESTLFLIMSNQKKKVARFVSKISEEKEMRIQNYISYNFSKVNSKLKVLSASPENIEVEIKAKVDITILEFPEDKLSNEEKIQKLNSLISKDLTAKAEKLVKKLQASNSDLFGIGRELIAYHPKTWEQIEWEEEYPNITITPEIEVDIVGHGIIN
ncbi:Ger(x)C family spore germination protein [Lysinibacillus xylanilyticus]|uniref:Ger(x)C family spore germination protein n=1 Tax=Lysinibacillus xylanilyticus TaxID=582475 RepID=UPI001585F516|nr:Ger(x)C family spore germination protein [Lysinibacillus xylanilyticus]